MIAPKVRRGRPCRLDPNEVADLYRAGTSTGAIARRYRCSDVTVRKALREAGVVYNPRRPCFPGRRAEAARELADRYRAGVSLLELARTEDISYGTCRRLVLEGGAQMRGRGGSRRRHDNTPVTIPFDEEEEL